MNKNRILSIIIWSILILFALVVKVAPKYYFSKGETLLKKHDYVSAHNYLKKAYTLDKKNKDYRYYYVQSLLNLSPTQVVQKEMFEIASSLQNDSAQDLAENKVSEWRNNITRNIGDNYIEQAPTDDGILRWDTAKFPLKYIIIDESQTNLPEYYNEKVNQAFAQWQQSTQFIKFATVKDYSVANIIIKFQPLPKTSCNDSSCKYVVGFTTPKKKGNILESMTIILYTNDPYGNFFSDKEIYNTTLHEIGHALGIMGHSYSSEDLMFMASDNSFYKPYRSSFQYISSKDINTIKLLYKLIPTITNTENLSTKGLIYAPIVLGTSKDISLRKLREAQNYIKQAPNLSNGYIDLAIALSELDRHKEAIKALNKALELSQTDTEKYLIFYNLASIYFNIQNFDEALINANKAKEISDCDEIKELISAINHSNVTKKKFW
jgi:tetratricopeptide (TPR) repeat protein